MDEVFETVQWHIDEIEKLFKPGKKITVLVRTPENGNADFCMTNDSLDQIIEMAKRRMGDAPVPSSDRGSQ